MKKPRWLMSRSEKRNDDQIEILSSVLGLALAVKGYQDREERRNLKDENIRLKNKLMEKELDAN